MNRGTQITIAVLLLLAAAGVYSEIMTMSDVVTIIGGVVVVSLIWFVVMVIRDGATVIRKTAQRMRSDSH